MNTHDLLIAKKQHLAGLLEAMRHSLLLSGEQADSFIKVLVQVEKNGVVESIEDWQVARMARNLAAHDYETDYNQVAQHFNALHTIKPSLYRMAYRLVQYAQQELDTHPASADFSSEFAAITLPPEPRSPPNPKNMTMQAISITGLGCVGPPLAVEFGKYRPVLAHEGRAGMATPDYYAGVRPDLIPFVVDRNPTKQGKYMPGNRISFVDEMHLRAERRDYMVILPWNLRGKVMAQLDYVREWGGKFVTAIPELRIAS